MHYLYKITNKLNGKVYIGQSKDDKYRWRQHCYFAKNPDKTGQYIHRAMAKYGVENFFFEIVAISKTQEDANEAESLLITQYNSRNQEWGYNLTVGGSYGGHSEETKQKLREATLKQIKTQGYPGLGTNERQQRSNISTALKALDKTLIYTPEVRKNMSDAHIGKKQTEESVKRRAETIRKNKGDMVCFVLDCGIIEDRRHAPVIDGIRYCGKHAARIKSQEQKNKK